MPHRPQPLADRVWAVVECQFALRSREKWKVGREGTCELAFAERLPFSDQTQISGSLMVADAVFPTLGFLL